MKDLIAQQKFLNEKFIQNEADPPTPAGGEEKPPEPEKLKIDIPDSPFEPDVNQVKDRLKHTLKQWEIKKYPSDEYRWKSYYKDIRDIVNYLDGEK